VFVVSKTKDPTKARAGRLGARARWDAEAVARGVPPGPRVLRLADLTPQQRRLVVALLDLGADAEPADDRSAA
jgi:hypothetical protein